MGRDAESTRRLGAEGEDLAVRELRDQGLEVLARNWRCRWGEIDVVAREWVDGSSTLVFCEVKTRRGTGYGTPAEAITYAKLRRLRRLCAEWLAAEQAHADAVRIDVMAVLMVPGWPPRIDHVRGVG